MHKYNVYCGRYRYFPYLHESHFILQDQALNRILVEISFQFPIFIPQYTFSSHFFFARNTLCSGVKWYLSGNCISKHLLCILAFDYHIKKQALWLVLLLLLLSSVTKNVSYFFTIHYYLLPSKNRPLMISKSE